MARRGMRVIAVSLGLLSLGWIPLKLVEKSWPEPESVAWMILTLALLVAPLVSLAVLFVLVWRLSKRARLAGMELIWLRALCVLTGPFGCVWAVFRLTEAGIQGPGVVGSRSPGLRS